MNGFDLTDGAILSTNTCDNDDDERSKCRKTIHYMFVNIRGNEIS